MSADLILRNGPGCVKIAWEARNWGRDGAFCAH